MGKWYQKSDLSRIQKVNGSKLNSKSFWYAFDHLVSEKQIKEEKAGGVSLPTRKSTSTNWTPSWTIPRSRPSKNSSGPT
jgi:hypothetical protein